MGNGSMRRSIAAASATVMAGAALVVGSAGVASAEPTAPVTGTQGGVSYERTISNGAPVWGDEITITNRVTRGSNWWLVYWIEDVKPSCLTYVPGSATWTVSGSTYTEGSNPSEVFVTETSTRIDPPAANSWQPPINFSADYRVTCNAGPLDTGGPKWNTTNAINGSANFSDRGPTIQVQRRGTSVFLANPINPETGEQLTFNVVTTNVPDGSEVAFTIDGEHAGVGTVNNNRASLTYTPTSAGDIEVRASFAQTPTHGGSAYTRTVSVSQANVDSSVTVNGPANAQVGVPTKLTATVSPAEAGGEVTFTDHGTEIGTAAVGADGTAILDWVPGTAGERTIDARFTGRPGVNASTGATNVTVAQADPDAVATSTSLGEISDARVGEQITLSATVDGDVTGGTVSFYDGSTLIGTGIVQGNGQATVNWTPTDDGERTIRAVYSGHELFVSSSAIAQVFVAPALVEPEPDPDPIDPADPSTGSLGSLTGSLGS